MTKIELTNEIGTFTVSLDRERMRLEEVMQFLVKPVLLAATYQLESIEEYIPET